MSALGRKRGGVSLLVNRLLFLQQGSHRLKRHTETDILSVADASLDASAMIGGSGNLPVFCDKHVVLLRSAGSDTLETLAREQYLFAEPGDDVYLTR